MNSDHKSTDTKTEGSIPKPSVTVKEIQFSDGSHTTLTPDDIVVFVGPNNAGKSASLKEIEGKLGGSQLPTKVIAGVDFEFSGSSDYVKKNIEDNSKKIYQGSNVRYSGVGYNINGSTIMNWTGNIHYLTGYFCRSLKTETRITDSNPAQSFSVLNQPATLPIQILYSNSDIEDRISGYFRKAFAQDLIVFRAGGSEIPLLVGKRPALGEGEDSANINYVKRLKEATNPLQEQGDGMRSFASVVLEMLASPTLTMLLIDEPEAFLHPPQARLLGEFLARERRENVQMFIATHSPDILMGILNASPHRLKIIRLQRNGQTNSVKELENSRAMEISSDPLMKYSSVLSGIFHQRAIICESDSDCLFYQAILSQQSVYDGPYPDVLFLHASGKHRMAKMASSLRALGVTVDVIADIDLLSEKETFQDLVEVMGGEWSTVESDWNVVKSAVESRKPNLNAEAIRREIASALENLEGQKEFPQERAREIRNTLKKSSAWGAVKEAGDSAIPNGEPTARMQKMRSYLGNLGLWIVPVGELEGFCKSVGSHGPKWVQKVIEERNLAEDTELSTARDFVRSIWERKLVPGEEVPADEGDSTTPLTT